MKLYKDIDVSLTYQNFGTHWLGILRGKEQDIELVFNGLFNFGATSGKLEFQGFGNTVATFGTDKKSLYDYFFTRFLLNKCNHKNTKKHPWEKHPSFKPAQSYAGQSIAELQEFGHESFINYRNKHSLDIYSTGTMSAEKPDMDFKDAVLEHCFKDADVIIDNTAPYSRPYCKPTI
jgi:hypothetical protein